MRTRGVIAVEPASPRLLMIPEQRQLLDTFAALVAIVPQVEPCEQFLRPGAGDAPRDAADADEVDDEDRVEERDAHDAEHALPFLKSGIEQLLEYRYAGIIHQVIYASEGGNHLVYCRLHLFGRRHAAGCRQLREKLAPLFFCMVNSNPLRLPSF